MLGRLDFTAYAPGGKPTLAVEAKRVFEKSGSWAASWRRNLMEDAPAGFAECSHMLVTPDRIFVWAAGVPPGELPTHQLDAVSHLDPYFRRVAISPAEIEPRAFERLVSWWLRDLTEQPASWAGNVSAQELQGAGLFEILAGAEIVQEDAA